MTQVEANTINLEDYRTPGAKVFTGRDKGALVRKNSKIDEKERQFEEIYFIIPDNIYSINPSFLEELFENVVDKLGKEKFLKKFQFINKGKYNFDKSLGEAIQRLSRKRTALD